jgi:hypothetical protein
MNSPLCAILYVMFVVVVVYLRVPVIPVFYDVGELMYVVAMLEALRLSATWLNLSLIIISSYEANSAALVCGKVDPNPFYRIINCFHGCLAPRICTYLCELRNDHLYLLVFL